MEPVLRSVCKGVRMSRTVVELFDEASELKERDRATLAGLLLESLELDRDPDVESAWAEEIQRRINQLESGQVTPMPWEEVKERLLSN